jgi:hypothetical protein
MHRLTVEFSEAELVHLLEEDHRHDRSAAEQVQALVQRSLALASVVADARAKLQPERLLPPAGGMSPWPPSRRPRS